MERCRQQSEAPSLLKKSAKQTPENRAKPATPRITTIFDSKLPSYARKIQNTELATMY